jgi:hypothetical protein
MPENTIKDFTKKLTGAMDDLGAYIILFYFQSEARCDEANKALLELAGNNVEHREPEETGWESKTSWSTPTIVVDQYDTEIEVRRKNPPGDKDKE